MPNLHTTVEWRHSTTCPMCAGSGEIEAPVSRRPDDTVAFPCPTCEGTGMVMVRVFEDTDGSLAFEVEGPASEQRRLKVRRRER